MTMRVDVSVGDQKITSLRIINLTENPTGLNTYRWVYSRHDLGQTYGLLSTKDGTIQHVMKDGAMALISRVAQAASECETP